MIPDFHSHERLSACCEKEKLVPTNLPKVQSNLPEQILDGSKKFVIDSKENQSNESKSSKTNLDYPNFNDSKSTHKSFPSLTEQELAMLTDSEKLQLSQLLEQHQLMTDREAALDLASFAKSAWKVLEPGTPIQWNWHLDLLCEYLTLVRDRLIRRLIINVPPQTGKSRFVNVFYPVWSWITHPERRFLSSSYSSDLSEGFNRDRARLIESDWFKRLFGDKIDLIRSNQQELENSVGGKMTATSTGGTATGKGAHDIIVDDPLNPQQAASEIELRTANVFFDETLRTRLSDQVNGPIVVIMQRLDTQDLTGHLLEKEPGVWTHVKLLMEAEEEESFSFPISRVIKTRMPEDLLWPEKFPRNVVEANLKIGMGSYVWAGQYQQRPTPRGGAIIKKHWLRYWNAATLPQTFDEVVQSWDLSFAKAAGSSFVSGQVWGRLGARKLLLYEVHGRMEYIEARQAIINTTALWPMAHAKLVENKANGPAVISDLRATIAGLIPIEPDGDKAARMMSVSPEFESGCVEIPDPKMPGYVWSLEWEEEILHFPQAPNDRGDACSQALKRLRIQVSNIMEYYRLLAASIPAPIDPSRREVIQIAEEQKKQIPVVGTTYRTSVGIGSSR